MTHDSLRLVLPLCLIAWVFAASGCGGSPDSPTDGGLDAGTSNRPPIASAQSYTVESGALLTFEVKASDPDGDALDFALANTPPGGTITALAPGKWSFVAAEIGTYALSVRVSDANASALAEITIHVVAFNAPPEPVADTYDAVGNTPLAVATQWDGPAVRSELRLLDNDSDPEGSQLTVTEIATSTEGAVVEIASDGSFTYLPPPGFSGTDQITYVVSDGSKTAPAAVTVSVVPGPFYVRAGAVDGDGRAPSPFGALGDALSTADVAGTVYVLASAEPLVGGGEMMAGQHLAGAGAPFTFGDLTVTASTVPRIEGGIVVADDVSVEGVEVAGSPTRCAIEGGATGGSVAISAALDASGACALALDGASGNWAFSGAITGTAARTAIRIANASAELVFSARVELSIDAAPAVEVDTSAAASVTLEHVSLTVTGSDAVVVNGLGRLVFGRGSAAPALGTITATGGQVLTLKDVETSGWLRSVSGSGLLIDNDEPATVAEILVVRGADLDGAPVTIGSGGSLSDWVILAGAGLALHGVDLNGSVSAYDGQFHLDTCAVNGRILTSDSLVSMSNVSVAGSNLDDAILSFTAEGVPLGSPLVRIGDSRFTVQLQIHTELPSSVASTTIELHSDLQAEPLWVRGEGTSHISLRSAPPDLPLVFTSVNGITVETREQASANVHLEGATVKGSSTEYSGLSVWSDGTGRTDVLVADCTIEANRGVYATGSAGVRDVVVRDSVFTRPVGVSQEELLPAIGIYSRGTTRSRILRNVVNGGGISVLFGDGDCAEIFDNSVSDAFWSAYYLSGPGVLASDPACGASCADVPTRIAFRNQGSPITIPVPLDPAFPASCAAP